MTYWFEFPTRERIRCLLKIEEAVQRTRALEQAKHITDHMVVLGGFCDLRWLWQRIELKNDIIHVIDKVQHTLKSLQESKFEHQIDWNLITKWLQKLVEWQHWLTKDLGKISEWFHGEALIELVANRSTVPGGLTSFDCPDYWAFIYQPFIERQGYLLALQNKMKPMVRLILNLIHIIRALGVVHYVDVINGMITIDAALTKEMSLVRLQAEEQIPWIPEFSGNHKKVHIKLRAPLHLIRPDKLTEMPKQIKVWLSP